MQVRFALSSSAVFSRTDTTTDSERFYQSVLEVLTDIEEQQEVDELLKWWNRWILLYRDTAATTNISPTRQIFPSYSSAQRAPKENSAMAKLKERRARRTAAALRDMDNRASEQGSNGDQWITNSN